MDYQQWHQESIIKCLCKFSKKSPFYCTAPTLQIRAVQWFIIRSNNDPWLIKSYPPTSSAHNEPCRGALKLLCLRDQGR